MFSSKLYDHKFDIDDILRALCNAREDGTPHTGRWLLNTRTGELIAESANAPTAHLTDGDDTNHIHLIEPLSLSTLPAFRQHPAAEKLAEEDVAQLDKIIFNAKNISDIAHTLNQHHAGGFLRERLKEIALEWLDERGLIPPSMRHVKTSAPKDLLPTGPRKVSIQ